MAEFETLPDDLRELLSLDDAPGPALPLTHVAAAAAVEQAVNAAARPTSSGLWPRFGVTASVASVASVVVGSGVAAFLLWRPAAENTVAVSKPQRQVSVLTEIAATARAAEPESDVQPVERAERDAPTEQPTTDGDDLLRRANQLRGAGKYRDAERMYVRVIRTVPHDRAAYVARVAAADLRREQLGDPAGALALYRAALAVPGALSAEAMRGVAQAQRMLGNTEEERKALIDFLEAHSHDAAASWAKRRLAEIDDEL